MEQTDAFFPQLHPGLLHLGPDVLKNVIAIAETRTERVTMTFPGQDKQSIFQPDRVA